MQELANLKILSIKLFRLSRAPAALLAMLIFALVVAFILPLQAARAQSVSRARERLTALQDRRDPESVDRLLGTLVLAATGSEKLKSILIECVENDITLGEICNTLRGVWGEYVAEGL
jgi:hypothetical protein